jgi:hypothetical protein
MSVAANSRQRRQRLAKSRRLIAAAALLASLGCWEEIHYTPKPDAAEATGSAEQPPPAEEPAVPPGDSAATVTEAPIDAAPEGTEPVLPPGGDELFAPQAAPESSEQTADSTDEAAPTADADSILPTPLETPATPATTAGEDEAVSSAEAAAPTPPTPAERRLAWQAMSKWTLAAAIYAKNLSRSPHAPILEEAVAAASELGLELPPLPTTPQPENLEAAVIEGLRGELAVALRNTFAARFGEAEGAAADVAVRSHLLLLTYSPRDADASLQAEGLRRAGEASGLPPELWTPLAALVEERASFLDVRQAVFDLHRRVDAHLAQAASSTN